jgi:hypothetical protein
MSVLSKGTPFGSYLCVDSVKVFGKKLYALTVSLFSVLSLCVGLASYGTPQDWLWFALLLGLFFFVCYVWEIRFHPHGVHGTMLKSSRCGCGSMYRLLFQRTSNGTTIDVDQHSKQRL